MNPPLTILGGGPAGLALAHYTHQAGHPFALFERAEELGGHCRTLRHAGHGYDTGAHRFHDRDAEITADVRALLGDELRSVTAPSKVFHRGRWLDFPPSLLGWLRAAGWSDTARSVLEVVRGRLSPREERTFEDRVLNRYGRVLGGPLLLDYSAKLWGLPGDRLDPDVATRRLSGLSLAALAREILFPRRRSRHLDGTFLYPRSGYGAIVESLTRGLPARSLQRGRTVTALRLDGRRVAAIELDGRETVEVPGRLVSTLPLTVLVRFLGDAVGDATRRAAGGLRFRHVRLLFLRLAQASVSTSATFYLPHPGWITSRLAEPRNRSPELAPAGETALVAEIPCFSGDEVSALDDEALARRVILEIEETGLVRSDRVLDWRHHRLENAYPVYTLDYRERLAVIESELDGFENLDRLGRGGRFFYSHLHDQMRMAKDYSSSLATSGASSGATLPKPSMPAHILRSARKLQ